MRSASALVIAAVLALPAAAQTAAPDLRGTWKGESESVIYGGGNSHHGAARAQEPQYRSVAFTLLVEKQEGRRFRETRVNSDPVAIVPRTSSTRIVPSTNAEKV